METLEPMLMVTYGSPEARSSMGLPYPSCPPSDHLIRAPGHEAVSGRNLELSNFGNYLVIVQRRRKQRSDRNGPMFTFFK